MLTVTSHAHHHNTGGNRVPALQHEDIAIYILFAVCCLLLTVFLCISVTNHVSIYASLSFVISAFFLLLCITYTWHKSVQQRRVRQSRRIGIHWNNPQEGRQSAHLIDNDNSIDIEIIDCPPKYDEITPPPTYDEIQKCPINEIIIL